MAMRRLMSGALNAFRVEAWHSLRDALASKDREKDLKASL